MRVDEACLAPCEPSVALGLGDRGDVLHADFSCPCSVHEGLCVDIDHVGSPDVYPHS